ncbi:hypothetical protein GCM10011351_29340 [Paraliobacillus quinghaiensis]|uniref:Uncharacterized protein n=1 Tax=Paraliobacillus quinghaiensis TaxID=470815 RepID=A0A917TXC5_9BACI|nr:short-chain dehydrogenase [Paraliobacillus quinghaiensis]GGM41282.1 hypothetical protein GCM10011351_29340 [Paraliobacillus quinghaiensis]
MKKGIVYLITLIFLSIFLFVVVAGTLKTNFPTISFFLAMLISHFIIDKNQWIVDFYENAYSGENEKVGDDVGNSQ